MVCSWLIWELQVDGVGLPNRVLTLRMGSAWSASVAQFGMASVNANFGGWRLSRRLALKSLGSMLHYLCNGLVPWKGYDGEDMNIQVCVTKCGLTLDTNVCRCTGRVAEITRMFACMCEK